MLKITWDTPCTQEFQRVARCKHICCVAMPTFCVWITLYIRHEVGRVAHDPSPLLLCLGCFWFGRRGERGLCYIWSSKIGEESEGKRWFVCDW